MMAVDSGASETVVNEEMLPTIETREGTAYKQGVEYELASGETIPNQGEKVFVGESENFVARIAGANKVTFTSAAPPVRYPHVYGINMPTRAELIAHGRSIDEISDELSADHMVYQKVDDLKAAIVQDTPITELDMSCFTGEYVTGTVTSDYLDWVESTQFS